MIRLVEREAERQRLLALCEKTPFGCKISSLARAYGFDKSFASFWLDTEADVVFCLVDGVMLLSGTVLDGGPVRLFLRLLLPMSGNALASLAILSMITAWNQYIWPLLVTNKNEMRTVQVGISMLQGLEFSDYTLVMAGIVLVLLPCVLIFVVGFRFFIAGITEGAVKG